MNLNPDSQCPICFKTYKLETLARSGGVCFRCIKKKDTPKGNCLLCRASKNVDTLNMRNGYCFTCHTRNINTSKEKCIKCNKEFSHSTLEKHNGICGACYSSQSISDNMSRLSLARSRDFSERDYSNRLNFLENKNIENKNIENKNIETKKQELKSIKFERINQPSCSICLEDWQDSDDIIILPNCQHYFHTNCIKDCLQLKKECPICKDIINH